MLTAVGIIGNNIPGNLSQVVIPRSIFTSHSLNLGNWGWKDACCCQGWNRRHRGIW